LARDLKKALTLSIKETLVVDTSLCLVKPSLIKYGPPLFEKWFLVIYPLYSMNMEKFNMFVIRFGDIRFGIVMSLS
jgi:hypothetical protein